MNCKDWLYGSLVATIAAGATASARATETYDYIFVIDDSGSIPRERFEDMRDAIADFVCPANGNIPLDGSVAIGVITFESNVDIDVPLTVITALNADDICNDVSSITWSQGGTDLEKGLIAARTMLTNDANGSVRHVIVSTDFQNLPAEFEAVADSIRSQPIPARLIAVSQVDVLNGDDDCPTFRVGAHRLANTPLADDFNPFQIVGNVYCDEKGGGMAAAIVDAACVMNSVDTGDCDSDGVPDECEADFDLVPSPDECELSGENDGNIDYIMDVFQGYKIKQTIVNADLEEDAEFGTSVSIDGDRLVVGAPDSKARDETNPGLARVFTRDGVGDWVQDGPDLFADSDSFITDITGFGDRVAIDADHLLVSDTWAGVLGTATGAVVAFEYDGVSWVESQRISGSGATVSNSLFGHAVAIDGDTAVIGAPGADNTSGVETGLVFVFEFDHSTGLWTETATLRASDGASNDDFGFDVDISGTTIIVGSPRDDDFGAQTGALYVFEYDAVSSAWPATETAKLIPSEVVASSFNGDLLGTAVAIDVDRLVGTAPEYRESNGDEGAAFIYQLVGGVWVQDTLIKDEWQFGDDQFGLSVALSGTTVFVGSPSDFTNNPSVGPNSNISPGAVLVYDWSPSGWEQTNKLLAPRPGNTGNRDRAGLSVAATESVAVVGGPRRSAGATEDTGAVHIFDSPDADYCAADFDGDGFVNIDDLDLFVAAYLLSTDGDPSNDDQVADMNRDGAYNIDDIDLFVTIFLAGCP